VNTRIGMHSMLFGLVLAFSVDILQGQEPATTDAVDVTVSGLSQHPAEFDGRLVRIRAVLACGWEGDDFISDPNPQSMPSRGLPYVWVYRNFGRERMGVGCSTRGSEQGWFTGHFHYLHPKYPENSVFDPSSFKLDNSRPSNGMFDTGPLQLEAVAVSILEPQPRSLSEAMRQGDLVEARKVLHSGVNLNVWNEFKSFPLFEAIAAGYDDFIEELLAAGADPKVSLPSGETALMIAAWNGKVKIAKVLLDHGVPVNAQDVHGDTALIFTSQTCPDGEMVQLLLDAGGDPNLKTNNGVTAPMAAEKNPIITLKLLKAGASQTAKNR